MAQLIIGILIDPVCLIFVMFVLTHLPSLETKGSVPYVPNLHFRFFCIEEGEEGAKNTLSLPPVPPVQAGATGHPGASQLIWES